MNYDRLRIGYAPYTPSLDLPGDRRRFPYYARSRGLKFELARPSGDYDLVVVTERADLTAWSRHSRSKSKIVFDFVDNYLVPSPNNLRDRFRGLAKFVVGEFDSLQWDFRETVQAVCQRSDAVVCAAEEYVRFVRPLCDNIHVILDFQDQVVRGVKRNYIVGEILNLVWEGLPGNVATLNVIRDALRRVASRRPTALHVVAPLSFRRYMGKFGPRRTSDVVKGLLNCVYLYEWNESTLSAIITACDLALIPIPTEHPIYRAKSENKLVFFWRMGIPTIVSATPAYERAMRECGVSMACHNALEWEQMLEKYAQDAAAREEAARCGLEYVRKRCSEEVLLARWDGVLQSLFG